MNKPSPDSVRLNSTPAQLKSTIAVIGAGAAGLPLVCQLSKQLVNSGLARVVLIDEQVNHVWKPRFHELASGVLDESSDFINLPLLAKQRGYCYEQGRVKTVDVKDKSIIVQSVDDESGNTIFPERKISYDYLVVSVGSKTNDYGIPGVEDNCYSLDSYKNAIDLRTRLTNLLVSHRTAGSRLRVAVVGGGAAGIELTAEIARMMQSIGGCGSSINDDPRFRLEIVEGSAQLLNRNHPGLSKKLSQYMENLGVTVHHNFPVSRVSANHIMSDDGDVIEADMIIWTAGIIAPQWLAAIKGLATNPINQLIVDETLACHGAKGVYAVGDCCTIHKDGEINSVPARAQAAKQMADYLSRRLCLLVEGRSPKEAFTYRDQGMLIGLSHFFSLGELANLWRSKGLGVDGALAKVMYSFIYWSHHASVRGRWQAFRHFLSSQMTATKDIKIRIH